MTVPQTSRSPYAAIAAAALAATAVAYSPQLVTDAGQVSRAPAALTWAWLVLLLVAAPVVAGVLARRWRPVAGVAQALLVGLPQLLAVLALVRLDVWLEVRSGYLLAGSGEEAMAYGIGTAVGAVAGAVLTVLVAAAVPLGVRWSPPGSRGAGPRAGTSPVSH